MDHFTHYYCPYRINSNFEGSPNIQPMDAMSEFELSEEEEIYYDDMMRQGRQEVNTIMMNLNTRLGYLYNELQKYRINTNTARYLFRTIVAFVVNNASKYTGSPEQRTQEILRDFRRRYPWVFFIMRSFGVPAARIQEIASTIIAFTLSNLTAAPAPPMGDMEQRANRIVNSIRMETDVFSNLKNYNINENRASILVREIVLYTIRNSDINQPPVNISERAAELVRQIENSNPEIVRNLQMAGVPAAQTRAILRTVVAYTLRSLYQRVNEY